MSPILRNILAVIAGLFGGNVINLFLVRAGHFIFPIEGVNPDDTEAFKAVLPDLELQYFLFPFLAHAIGTLAGAYVAGAIAANSKMIIALVIGGCFFLAGVAINLYLNGPVWFTAVDLVLAYFPMAWIGGRLSNRS
ncbi:MAG: hypothetical protein ACFB10_23280 [Salibacteraceae bacterium]